jgi:Fur family ferric uptake transcriptional regulator
MRVPASHPELTERLGNASLDRATIYRNLVALTEAGILIRTQLGDHVWRFELPPNSSAQHGLHPHFVCNDCGDIACLSESAVTLGDEATENEVAEVQLRGRCSARARA